MQDTSSHSYNKSIVLPIDISYSVYTARTVRYLPLLSNPQEYYSLQEMALAQTEKVIAFKFNTSNNASHGSLLEVRFNI